MAKHPAAFINTLSETRDMKTAIKLLQETWDELQDLRAEIARSRTVLEQIAVYCEAEPQTSAQALMAKMAREALRSDERMRCYS